MSPRRTRKSMPRNACTPAKLLAMPVASTMKSSPMRSEAGSVIGQRTYRNCDGRTASRGKPPRSAGATGRSLTGAVEDLVILVEILRGDHRGRQWRQIGNALAFGEGGEELGR